MASPQQPVPTRVRARRGACALLLCCALVAAAACDGGSSSRGGDAHSLTPSPVGELLSTSDATGDQLREVDREGAPDVRIAVRPGAAENWDVRLTVTNFRFSAERSGTGSAATTGRGYAVLYLEGRRLARLHQPRYRLSAASLGRGTHELTVRLHADDGTVWAVDGQAVEDVARVTLAPRKDAPAG
ncbi:hypothetical protein ACFWIA_18915 [Streptomyces sp. NPDC127068]|uniref:hypothetical protein n=1 Tax=Streptomyces sp. NPDC127068 TaxID=3347127 RepID=UPI003646E636